MQRVGAARRLARGADIETMRLGDVHVLMWIFSDARTDDGEVFLLVATRTARIDKCVGAGPQFVVAYQALTQGRG